MLKYKDFLVKNLNDMISLKDYFEIHSVIHTGYRSRPYGYVGTKNRSDAIYSNKMTVINK